MANPPPPRNAPGESELLVLVVEDNRETLDLLSRLLRSRGMRVLTARDGLSALQILDETPVDAVVSDLHLPGPTGEMVLEFARRRRPRCRVILLSGWVTRRARARAEAVGAAILEKPAQIDELIEELNRERPAKKT